MHSNTDLRKEKRGAASIAYSVHHVRLITIHTYID